MSQILSAEFLVPQRAQGGSGRRRPKVRKASRLGRGSCTGPVGLGDRGGKHHSKDLQLRHIWVIGEGRGYGSGFAVRNFM